MKRRILHLVLILLPILFISQCRPLYLTEAEAPVPLSDLHARSPRSLSGPELKEEIMVLQEGENLSSLMILHLSDRDLVNELVSLISTVMDLRRTPPGQEIHYFWEGDRLHSIRLPRTNDIILLKNQDSQWTVDTYSRSLTRLVRFKTGEIDSSLYNAALDAGIPLPVLMEMIQLYSFVVDFQRDIYKGDYFQVAYEEYYDENRNPVDTGRVIFAYLYSNGRTREHKMFRYTDASGKSDYFDEEGKSVRRELLKTPINGAYISSGYGMRISPILGYSKMHQGVDFAAPQGTPIFAAGSGTVAFAGWSDVYGYYVKLRHVNHYVTLYGHMVSFARGIYTGAAVRQGQVIGYVGNTGMSTGPHCHYEVFYYGRNVNPSTIKFPPGRVLSGQELENYQVLRESYMASFF